MRRRFRMRLAVFTFIALAAGLPQAHARGQAKDRPRLIVLTDIGGDPDDQQSMVRLLVHSENFDIEGLIASASGTPGELQGDKVQPQLIAEMVDAYAAVYPNLKRHAIGFPQPGALKRVIKSGNPHRGRVNVGEGHDTEGSKWIIRVVDRPDPRPVNIAVWGGPTELAQALWRVRADRSDDEVKRFVGKLRVHAIDHQDDSGPGILQDFPDLFYVLSVSTEASRTRAGDMQDEKKVDRRESVYRGIYLGGDMDTTSRAWVDTNVRIGHGPLGAKYPDKTSTAPNPHGVMKEGDTPSWFYFLSMGQQDAAQPGWGGWGGRFQAKPGHPTGKLFRDAADTVGDTRHPRATVWRWRPQFQNEFAARMDWCVAKRPGDANHPPRVTVNRDATNLPLVLSAPAGSTVKLDASRSRDPDQHRLTYSWWHYPEAGSFPGTVAIAAPSSATIDLPIPAEAAGHSIHVMLQATDSGSPPLTRWKRVVLNVSPGPGGRDAP